MKITVVGSDVIDFGKYKSKNVTFDWIFQNDPRYLIWLHFTKPGYLSGDILAKLNVWASDNMSIARKILEKVNKAKTEADQLRKSGSAFAASLVEANSAPVGDQYSEPIGGADDVEFIEEDDNRLAKLQRANLKKKAPPKPAVPEAWVLGR